MATPPVRTEISDTYPNPTNAVARAGFGKLYDYVTGLLGATGNPAEARTALGAISVADVKTSNLQDYANDTGTTTGLTYGYKAGSIRSDIIISATSAGTVLLTASTTNYVEVSPLGVVSKNVIGFTSGAFPLAIVVTDVSSITSLTDKRGFVNVVVANSSTDADRQNSLLNWVYQSKLYAGYRRGINLFADGYKAADGINAGASSGYTLDTTAGKVGPTTSSVTLGTYSAAYAAGAVITFFDRSSIVPNSSTVSTIGVYSLIPFTGSVKIALKNTSTNYTLVYNQSVTHAGAGWQDFALTTPYTVPGAGSYYVGCYTGLSTISGTAAVGTRAYFTGDATGSFTPVIEDGDRTAVLRFSTTTLATILSTAQTISTSTKVRGLIEYDATNSPVLNTDFTLEVSCNGGANWTTSVLTSVGLSQNGRVVAETSETTCASGTSLLYRVKTLNYINVPLYGVALTAKA